MLLFTTVASGGRGVEGRCALAPGRLAVVRAVVARAGRGDDARGAGTLSSGEGRVGTACERARRARLASGTGIVDGHAHLCLSRRRALGRAGRHRAPCLVIVSRPLAPAGCPPPARYPPFPCRPFAVRPSERRRGREGRRGGGLREGEGRARGVLSGEDGRPACGAGERRAHGLARRARTPHCILLEKMVLPNWRVVEPSQLRRSSSQPDQREGGAKGGQTLA